MSVVSNKVTYGKETHCKTKKEKYHQKEGSYKISMLVFAKVGASLVWARMDLNDSLRWSTFLFQVDLVSRMSWKFANVTGSNKS